MNNYAHKGSQAELYTAIDWAKKAEQDSKIKISNGETKYLRTESNAIMQIAMLQGKISRLRKYEDVKANENAIEYYYKGFSDSNNIAASKTLLNNSRGTHDFKQFVNALVNGDAKVGEEWSDEKNFLINIGICHT